MRQSIKEERDRIDSEKVEIIIRCMYGNETKWWVFKETIAYVGVQKQIRTSQPTFPFKVLTTEATVS